MCRSFQQKGMPNSTMALSIDQHDRKNIGKSQLTTKLKNWAYNSPPTKPEQRRKQQQQTNALAVSNVGRHSQSARLRSLLGRAYVLKVRAVTPLRSSSTAALTPATFLFMPVCRTQYGDHTRPNPSHTASCGVPQPPPSAALHNGERAIRSWPRWLHPP